MMFRFLLLTATVGFLSPEALGWDQYGHELVQITATQVLLENRHPLARMFAANAGTLKQVAAVPDNQWRLPPEAFRAKKFQPLAHEGSLHFFAVDAYVHPEGNLDAILELPASAEYGACTSGYQGLLKRNQELLAEFNLTGKPAHEHGTAPWRVTQLYDLSVEALKRKQLRQALFLMTVLGHYVADLAAPLHTTLNYNGQLYPVPASGVFDAYERRLVEHLVDSEGSTFQADIAELAISELGVRGMDGLTRARIIPELLKAVRSGYRYVDGILAAYSEQCGKAAGRGLASVKSKRPRQRHPGGACEPGRVPEPTREFLKEMAGHKIPGDSEHGIPEDTVQGMTLRRLATGSALLARIWAAAYAEAGSPDFKGRTVAGFRFDDLAKADHYPAPSYLPVTKLSR